MSHHLARDVLGFERRVVDPKMAVSVPEIAIGVHAVSRVGIEQELDDQAVYAGRKALKHL